MFTLVFNSISRTQGCTPPSTAPSGRLSQSAQPNLGLRVSGETRDQPYPIRAVGGSCPEKSDSVFSCLMGTKDTGPRPWGLPGGLPHSSTLSEGSLRTGLSATGLTRQSGRGAEASIRKHRDLSAPQSALPKSAPPVDSAPGPALGSRVSDTQAHKAKMLE